MENIPPEGQGFIIACNHQSYMDPPLLGMRLKHHQLLYMAKKELFDKPIFGNIIRALGAFPVSRGKGDTSALDTAIETVANGNILGLFPEGTRSKNGVPLKPKSGAVVIASRTGANIVPAAIKYENKRFRGTVVIRYGQVIPNEELGLSDNSMPSEIKQASRFVMDKIIALFNK